MNDDFMEVLASIVMFLYSFVAVSVLGYCVWAVFSAFLDFLG